MVMDYEIPAKPVTTVQTSGASVAAAKTSWAHDPYAPEGSDQQRLTEISRTFIGLFEKALAKRQCRVATGAEIEMSFDDYSKEKMRGIVAAMNEAIKQKPRDQQPHHHERKALGLWKKAVKQFHASGIYRVYEDVGKLEVVTRPQRPIETVSYARGVNRILAESTQQFKELAPEHAISGSAQQVKDMAQWGRVRFGEIRFATRMHGGHLNFSLHRTDSTVPSHRFDLGANNITRKQYKQVMRTAFLNYPLSDGMLLLHCDHSIGRHATWKADNHELKKADKGGELSVAESQHFEWRLPDSGSDMHLAMLVGMAAVYGMAEAVCKVTGKEQIPKRLTDAQQQRIEGEIAKQTRVEGLRTPHYAHVWNSDAYLRGDAQERIDAFRDHSKTVAMMRAVVEQLVPPQEQANYLAMVDEFRECAIRQSQQQHAASLSRLRH